MFGKKRHENGGTSPRRIPMPERIPTMVQAREVPGYTPKHSLRPEGRGANEAQPNPNWVPPPMVMQAREVQRQGFGAEKICPVNGGLCRPDCAWYSNRGCAMVAGVGELYALVEAVLRMTPPDVELPEGANAPPTP